MVFVEAGQLKKVVVFEDNTLTTQGAGKKDGWATLLTTRGFLKKSSSRRSLDNAEKVFDNSWELITRYETALETGLAAKTVRVLIETIYYTIDSFDKIDEKRSYYSFRLTQHDK